MTLELELALQLKCQKDERLRLLQAQWEYDRRLLGQALQSVSSVFPHYSRHDSSHSDSILVQITRVLGKRIELLSATDLWLLLESAYWHDSGMIIDADTAKKWWTDDDRFKNHLAELRESPDSMLAAAARCVTQVEISAPFWPLQVRKAVTLVLADYGRVLHADRSGHAVRHPLLQGIQSPRTLIPQRLYAWLAEIAVRHGTSREDVMTLPLEEGGLGTEMCHPRFVAFMLRLGDLLDLDNGRFCEVLTRSIGALPASSMDHVGKHASISHFSVTPERIEVIAACDQKAGDDAYGAYEAISSWLEWLRSELVHLAAHWSTIAPAQFGAAPSLGPLKATLDGYVSLEPGKRPKFSVDEAAFLRLVRSNNLYRSPFAWVREILTNAEDASLLRLHQESGIPDLLDVENPLLPIRDKLKDYPIHVKLWREGEHVYFEIWDHGVGISEQDLGYMLTIGSSQRNPERRKAVREMPEHGRPTGSFGIGLQSVFMAASEVDILSMHAKTRDRLAIKIRRAQDAQHTADVLSPPIERSGVYIRRLPEDQDPKIAGTIVRIRLDQVQPGSFSSDSTDARWSSYGTSYDDLDPIHAERGVADFERVLGELQGLSRTMLASITINGQAPDATVADPGLQLFDRETKLLFKFREPNSAENPIRLSYRGAHIALHQLPLIPFLDLELSAEFGKASDLVAASRETLTPEGEMEIADRFQRGLHNVFPKYVARLPNSDGVGSRHIQLVSLFAKVYLEDGLRGHKYENAWRELTLLKGAGTGSDISCGQVDGMSLLNVLEFFSIGAGHANTPRPPGEWYQLAGPSRDVDKDVLLSLFPHACLVAITGSERRYELIRDPAAAFASSPSPAPAPAAEPKNAQTNAISALLKELLVLPLNQTTRVVWPSLEGYEHLALDTRGSIRFSTSKRLPSWVLSHRWLTHRCCVARPMAGSERSRCSLADTAGASV